MPRKQQFPLHRVSENAISVRSGACACCTVLVDESHLPAFNKLEFDPIAVALRAEPKKQYDQLRRWAGRGKWMAIASRPDILDSDGVPYLDLVVGATEKPTRSKSKVSDNGPSDGIWYEPVHQFLDLPTGRLRLIYCDEFFHDHFDQDEDMTTDEQLRHGKEDAIYTGASSIQIRCEPGFYRAQVFTRFDDEMSDQEPPEGSADLAIFMEPVKKPTSFKISVPLLPIHPDGQDVDALIRQVRGEDSKPANETLTPVGVNEKGEIYSFIEDTVFGIKMALPPSVAEDFGYEQGLMLTLEACGVTVNGVSLDEPNPKSHIRKQIEKEMKKPGTFVAFLRPSETQRELMGDLLRIQILKHGRKGSIHLSSKQIAPAILRKQTNRSGAPRRISLE
ncbi:hypothetical protein SH528x_002986 [Novipirellula sp. SH528]|uniref:hypothetical protein n=1 Tax=Novipirellula sp. SH528 TaxID=3454466 RepID=UPI003F9EC02C